MVKPENDARDIFIIILQITGDNMMISEYLKNKKAKKSLTNQELADLSGVPVGTVNRILSNQTDNPSFQTVCDIVVALDGSLDELAGIKPEQADADETPSGRTHLEMSLMYKQIISSKDRWLCRAFICVCVLVAFILCLFVFDVLNPHVGFFHVD